MPPAIRSATPQDLPDLLAIEAAVFPGDRMSARQFRHHILHPHNRVLVIDLPGVRVAAFGILMLSPARLRARMYSLAVRPECRGKGLARRLCVEMETLARMAGHIGISLEVRADNEAALALYRSLGYEPSRYLETYYDDRSAGWRMHKTLKEPCDSGKQIRRKKSRPS